MALNDGREFPATLILKDEQTDLAVLRLKGDGAEFPSIQFADSDSLEVGDLVLAIGDPFGVGQTVTSGIVSALARTKVGISDYQFFIQTDAAINPGNSGGALVDMDGQLVGINTAIFSKSGGSHGIGFAIPSNMVRLVVQSALKGGKVQRPWLGASLQTLTSDLAESLGLARPAGALVDPVHAQGPAETAGLQVGDVVVSVDGTDVQDPEALEYRFVTKGVGGKVELGLYARGQKVPDDNCDSHARSRSPPRDTRDLDRALIRFAGSQRGQSFARRQRRSSAWTTTATTGVVVLEVERRSNAAGCGLRKRGDIIVGRQRSGDYDRSNQLAALLADTARRAGDWRSSGGGKVFNLAIAGLRHEQGRCQSVRGCGACRHAPRGRLRTVCGPRPSAR